MGSIDCFRSAFGSGRTSGRRGSSGPRFARPEYFGMRSQRRGISEGSTGNVVHVVIEFYCNEKK